jgi:hypothetical protein
LVAQVDDQLGAVVRYAARFVEAAHVPHVATLYATLMVQEHKHRQAHTLL